MKYLIILLLTVLTASAQCVDPNDPNCLCTNCPPFEPPTSAVYTNGELHLIITSSTILLTNGNLLDDYVLESSSNLSTWTAVTEKFETDTNGTALFSFSPTNAPLFFRARVATLIVYANAGAANGSYCGGTYIGYANYYGFDGGYGYSSDTNMTRHVIYDGTGRTNTIVSYLGRFGDSDCDTFAVNITEVGSQRYRATLFFPNNLPTNSYPARLKGLKDD